MTLGSPASQHFFDESSPPLDDGLDNAIPLATLECAFEHTCEGENLSMHRTAWETIQNLVQKAARRIVTHNLRMLFSQFSLQLTALLATKL